MTVEETKVTDFSKEEKMPLYEYECHNCKKIFTAVLSLREHERKETVCPGCGSKEVEQLMSAFVAHTASKT